MSAPHDLCFGELRAALHQEPLDFAHLIDCAERYRAEDLAHYDEVGLPYVRQALHRDYEANPITIQRKSHWTNANQHVLEDSFKLTLKNEAVLSVTTGEHVPGLELARSVSFHNTDRWNTQRLAPKHAGALAQNTWLRGLRGIELLEQKLGAKGFVAWMGGVEFEDLRALVCNGGVVREDGAEALARCTTLHNLEVLVLSQGRIKAGGVKHLAQGVHLRALREVVLDENQLDAGACKIIAQSEVFSGVERLELNSNKHIGAIGVEALAQSSTLSKLRHLGLRGVDMRQKGAEALMSSAMFTRLESLRITGGNHIPEGCHDALRALAATHNVTLI